ncbi:hypothetical protein [Deinococcus budaensis]|uniref:RNase H type-1 domain-containing protein n=1 Tax=Deinococcus budaensis TaxID=1665626 RepID=A0A7W8GF03_9DEIO|nr:hypothetical protein [Deinococcus budaensis]MBB5234416.1 hypothetical protein [Deinococcus budaensis]
MPEARRPDPEDLWHVYTDGSTRHERRQTFSGWAARAVQPGSRQVRQASGAGPGGTSLAAETEAILAGLRLVPGGAPARLYSDLALPALLAILHGPAGEAARDHLRDLWVQPVARSRGRHPADMHHVARRAEAGVREGEALDAAGLHGAALEMQVLARAGEDGAALPLGGGERLAGQTRPLVLEVGGLPPLPAGGRPLRLNLTLGLGRVEGQGRGGEEALRVALARPLALLTRGALVELRVPSAWLVTARAALGSLGAVQVRPGPDPAGPPEEAPPAEEG